MQLFQRLLAPLWVAALVLTSLGQCHGDQPSYPLPYGLNTSSFSTHDKPHDLRSLARSNQPQTPEYQAWAKVAPDLDLVMGHTYIFFAKTPRDAKDDLPRYQGLGRCRNARGYNHIYVVVVDIVGVTRHWWSFKRDVLGAVAHFWDQAIDPPSAPKFYIRENKRWSMSFKPFVIYDFKKKFPTTPDLVPHLRRVSAQYKKDHHSRWHADSSSCFAYADNLLASIAAFVDASPAASEFTSAEGSEEHSVTDPRLEEKESHDDAHTEYLAKPTDAAVARGPENSLVKRAPPKGPRVAVLPSAQWWFWNTILQGEGRRISWAEATRRQRDEELVKPEDRFLARSNLYFVHAYVPNTGNAPTILGIEPEVAAAMRHEHHKVFILIKFSRTDIRTKSLKSFQLHAAAYYWDAIPYLRYVGEEGNMRELPVRMRLRDGYARWPTAVLPHEDIRYEVIPTTLYRHHSGPVERRLRARTYRYREFDAIWGEEFNDYIYADALAAVVHQLAENSPPRQDNDREHAGESSRQGSNYRVPDLNEPPPDFDDPPADPDAGLQGRDKALSLISPRFSQPAPPSRVNKRTPKGDQGGISAQQPNPKTTRIEKEYWFWNNIVVRDTQDPWKVQEQGVLLEGHSYMFRANVPADAASRAALDELATSYGLSSEESDKMRHLMGGNGDYLLITVTIESGEHENPDSSQSSPSNPKTIGVKTFASHVVVRQSTSTGDQAQLDFKADIPWNIEDGSEDKGKGGPVTYNYLGQVDESTNVRAGVLAASAEWISRHLRWSARSNCKTYVRDLAQSLMFPGWRGEKGSVSGRLPNPRVHVVDDTYWYWNNVVRGLSEDNKDYGGKDWKLRVQRDNPRLRAKRTYFFLGRYPLDAQLTRAFATELPDLCNAIWTRGYRHSVLIAVQVHSEASPPGSGTKGYRFSAKSEMWDTIELEPTDRRRARWWSDYGCTWNLERAERGNVEYVLLHHIRTSWEDPARLQSLTEDWVRKHKSWDPRTGSTCTGYVKSMARAMAQSGPTCRFLERSASPDLAKRDPSTRHRDAPQRGDERNHDYMFWDKIVKQKRDASMLNGRTYFFKAVIPAAELDSLPDEEQKAREGESQWAGQAAYLVVATVRAEEMTRHRGGKLGGTMDSLLGKNEVYRRFNAEARIWSWVPHLDDHNRVQYQMRMDQPMDYGAYRSTARKKRPKFHYITHVENGKDITRKINSQAATWWNEYPYKEEAQAGGATYKKFLEFLIKPLVERPRGSQVAQDDESSQSGNDKRALARVERTPATSPDQHDAGSPSGTDTAQLGDRVHSK